MVFFVVLRIFRTGGGGKIKAIPYSYPLLCEQLASLGCKGWGVTICEICEGGGIIWVQSGGGSEDLPSTIRID